MAVTEVDSLMKFKDRDGNITAIYPNTKAGNVSGLSEAIRNQSVTTTGDGSAYVATIDGISALTTGVSFVMIPHVESTSSSPTINVNGLGAVRIRRRLSTNTTTTSAGNFDEWLTANKPIRITYDGTFWIADLPRPVATDLSGNVLIANGGTSANTLAGARKSLGITNFAHNLLNNSDFRNPVNQRGNTTYSLSAWGGYTIDRWAAYAYDCTVTISNSGVELSGSIYQSIEQEIAARYNGKTVTVAAKIDGSLYCAHGQVNLAGSYNVSANVDTPYGRVMVTCEDTNSMFFILNNTTASATVEWAALYEGEYTAETLPEYQPKGYMVEALNCGALNVKTTATLSSSSWSSSAPYSQTISITGMAETDTPHVSPVYSDTLATAKNQKTAWEAVSKAVAAAGSITFYCFEDKPTTDIPIQVEVNR